MDAFEEIELLDEQCKALARSHPQSYGQLQVNNSSFRACTAEKWRQKGWNISDTQVQSLLNGNEAARREVLLMLLSGQMIREVVVVSGVDGISVNPL